MLDSINEQDSNPFHSIVEYNFDNLQTDNNPFFIGEILINIIQNILDSKVLSILLSLYSTCKMTYKILNSPHTLSAIRRLVPIPEYNENLTYIIWKESEVFHHKSFSTIVLDICGPDKCLTYYTKRNDKDRILFTLQIITNRKYPVKKDYVRNAGLVPLINGYLYNLQDKYYISPYTENAIMTAIESNNSSILNLFLRHIPDYNVITSYNAIKQIYLNVFGVFFMKMISHACHHSSINIVNLLLEDSRLRSHYTYCGHNHHDSIDTVALIKTIDGLIYKVYITIGYIAAQMGNTELLEIAIKANILQPLLCIPQIAIKNNHLDILERCLEFWSYSEHDIQILLDTASTHKSVLSTEYLHPIQNNYPSRTQGVISKSLSLPECEIPFI